MDFGSNLARIRRSRGWSQLELSLRSGISQRHISFLETGKSQPGDRSISKLSKALALTGWEQRTLLKPLAPTDSSQLKRAPDTKLIEEVMTRMCPWPSYAFKLDGTLLATNSALANLLRSASPDQDLWQTTASPTGPNIYDLVFHPTGLLRWMENPKEVLPETLRRLRIEASSDSALESTLKRIESYPSARSISLMNEIPPPVLVERYKVDTRAFSIISIISHLASPGEIELDHLRIESFVPADKASEAVISEITKPK